MKRFEIKLSPLKNRIPIRTLFLCWGVLNFLGCSGSNLLRPVDRKLCHEQFQLLKSRVQETGAQQVDFDLQFKNKSEKYNLSGAFLYKKEDLFRIQIYSALGLAADILIKGDSVLTHLPLQQVWLHGAEALGFLGGYFNRKHLSSLLKILLIGDSGLVPIEIQGCFMEEQILHFKTSIDSLSIDLLFTPKQGYAGFHISSSPDQVLKFAYQKTKISDTISDSVFIMENSLAR